jgi:hypothetical protein
VLSLLASEESRKSDDQGVEHFGGGKRAKVGLAAIPECQDSALLARQVRIVSVDVCGF